MGLDVKATNYLKLQNRLTELENLASIIFNKYDALVSPTTVMRAMKVEDCEVDALFMKEVCYLQQIPNLLTYSIYVL